MRRKEAIYKGLSSEYTAWELASKLFSESNYIHIKRLVLAETLAYLEALNEEGLVNKEETGNKYIYRNKFKIPEYQAY